MQPISTSLLGLLFGMATLAAPLASADDLSRPPAAGPFPKVAIPNAVTETLPNGLRVFVLQDKRQPTVTYRLVVKSGRALDADKPGRAALVAAMLNKGTKADGDSPALSAEEFATKTDFLGAAVEAAAGDDSISVLASGLSRDAGEILGYLKSAALLPAFHEAELEMEKQKAVSALIQQQADPSALTARLANQLYYKGIGYGVTPTPETVQALTRDDLSAFHAGTFLPNNATLAIVGDIDPKEAIEQVKAALGGWKSGESLSQSPSSVQKLENVSVHVIDRPASVQSDLMVLGTGVERKNADLPQLMVVNSVLGGGFSGRLFANLREKNGYTYGAYSSFAPRKDAGVFSATAQVRNAVTGAAVKEMIHEINRLTTEPIPEAELTLQKNYFAGNFMMSLESNRRTAERLQEVDLFGLPEDYYEKFVPSITALEPAKAEELARQYLNPKQLLVIVTGNAKEIVPQLEAFGPVTVYDTDLKPQPKTP